MPPSNRWLSMSMMVCQFFPWLLYRTIKISKERSSLIVTGSLMQFHVAICRWAHSVIFSMQQWTICTVIACQWVRDRPGLRWRSVSHLHMISVFPTSRKLFFLSPFRTVLSAIHMQVTDQPSPDAPSLTQAIIVQMVYSMNYLFRWGFWEVDKLLSQWALCILQHSIQSSMELWLATQLNPQNDWTGWQNRVNYDVFAPGPIVLFGEVMYITRTTVPCPKRSQIMASYIMKASKKLVSCNFFFTETVLILFGKYANFKCICCMQAEHSTNTFSINCFSFCFLCQTHLKCWHSQNPQMNKTRKCTGRDCLQAIVL